MRLGNLLPYFAAFIVVTLVCFFVYTEVQQVLRLGANDPQIQMAEDVAAGVARGRWPSLGSETIEISTSLAPFLLVMDENGRLLTTNASLDGHAPNLPAGVLDWVRRHGEDRISWQPRRGVRIALVVAPVKGLNGGFVACGRSLREVEKRIALASQGTALGWVVLLAAGFGGVFVCRRKLKAGN